MKEAHFLVKVQNEKYHTSSERQTFIDECSFLCYYNECIMIDDRKGHFLWKIRLKIKKIN